MAVVREVRQFGVYLVVLGPARGSEIRKTRPCLIISPDEMNRHARTVIIAPMTTKARPYPTRVTLRFQGKEGQIALDQIRTVDKSRLTRRLGTVSSEVAKRISAVLVEMFSLE
jgi:mRNA interferase MazF